MPHEVVASLIIPLPDDPQQMTESLSFVAKTWSEMLETLKTHQPNQLEPVIKFHVNEVSIRAKPTTNGRKTRGERTSGTTTQQEAANGDA